MKLIFINQLTNLIILSFSLIYLKRGQVIKIISEFTIRELYWNSRASNSYVYNIKEYIEILAKDFARYLEVFGGSILNRNKIKKVNLILKPTQISKLECIRKNYRSYKEMDCYLNNDRWAKSELITIRENQTINKYKIKLKD